MKKQKLMVRYLYVGSILSAAMLCLTPFGATQAQENDELDSYLTQISEQEPPQEVLSREEVLEDTSTDPETNGVFGEVFSEIADVIPFPEADDNEQEQAVVNDGDALPNIPGIDNREVSPGMNLPVNGNARLSTSGMDIATRTPQELEEEIRREAFDAAITGLFPLTPDNIKTLLRKNEEITFAKDTPISGIPTPQINVETISLDPGVAPMSIKTAAGFITTLNILDVTGAPWPIQDVSWAGEYEIVEPEEGGHVIRITPLSKTAYGNMSIRLLTLKTPVTIQLETNLDKVQYRVDARIPEYGPFAKAPLIEGSSQRVAGDTNIMSVLDGVLPEKAEKLYVSGVDGRTSAYTMNNMTYVRTPLTLISPSWEQSVSSADGMHVYAMSETPVVLLSDNGQVTRANLTIARDSDNE